MRLVLRMPASASWPNVTMSRLIVITLSLISLAFLKDKTAFVEISGKKIYYVEKGTGKPTVVFVTGLGVPMDDFSKIQTQIAKRCRTISYDRAGIGKSETIENERNLGNISIELDSVLTKTGLDNSLILVGHSRGGLIARYFANQHPDKVSGLILIDPAIPELKWRKRALRTDTEKIQFDNFYKAFYSDSAEFSATIKSEFKNFYTTDSASLVGNDFPQTIPITIIASNKTTKEKYSKEETAIKVELLNAYVKSAPHIKLMLTAKSGHFIHAEEPNLVIDAITTMADKLK